MTRRRGVATRGALALAIAAVSFAARLAAHPAATTSLILTFGDRGTVEVAIEADADPLAMKLSALQMTPDQSVHLTIDGAPVPLAIAGTERSTAVGVARVRVRMSGAVPPGSREFRASSALVLGSYPLIVRRAGVDGESIVWLEGSRWSPSAAVPRGTPPRRGGAAFRDFALGFTHILPNGLDHILFVLGLFLLGTSARSVLAQVSAFTLAHSITLGLTLYGVVSLPSAVVEPLIALSIVYVACENLFTARLTPWRLALVFAFGLLHGMGFAEALARLNLARADFLRTLVSFNAGVEAGQLSVIAAAALVVYVCRVPSANYRRLVARPCSIAIATIGVVWVIERLI